MNSPLNSGSNLELNQEQNMPQSTCQRVLLKLSGESLAGDAKFGIEADMLASVAKEIKSIIDIGVQLAIVVGGGNFFRGIQRDGPNWFRLHRYAGYRDECVILATGFRSLWSIR